MRTNKKKKLACVVSNFVSNLFSLKLVELTEGHRGLNMHTCISENLAPGPGIQLSGSAPAGKMPGPKFHSLYQQQQKKIGSCYIQCSVIFSLHLHRTRETFPLKIGHAVTVSQKQPFSLSVCYPQVSCYSNRKPSNRTARERPDLTLPAPQRCLS